MKNAFFFAFVASVSPKRTDAKGSTNNFVYVKEQNGKKCIWFLCKMKYIKGRAYNESQIII